MHDSPLSGMHSIGVVFEYDLQPQMGWRHNPKKKYYYRTWRNDINEGDIVVVMSPTTGATCVRVVEVLHNTKVAYSSKYIVDKVDFDEYHAQLKRDSDEYMLRQEEARRKKEAREIYLKQRIAIQEELNRIDGEIEARARDELEARIQQLKSKNRERDKLERKLQDLLAKDINN